MKKGENSGFIWPSRVQTNKLRNTYFFCTMARTPSPDYFAHYEEPENSQLALLSPMKSHYISSPSPAANNTPDDPNLLLINDPSSSQSGM